MKLPAVVAQLLRSASPTLLTALALPPPANVLAASVASAALAKLAPADHPGPLDPDQTRDLVAANAANPALLPALRQAEADLSRFEADNDFRFAELDARDRADARAFHSASGMSERIFQGGIWIIWIALAAMVLLVGGLIFLVFKRIPIPTETQNLAIAAFGLIGTAVGFVNGLAATVVAFYWGSSQGSKDKADTISASMRRLNEEIGRAANPAPAELPPPPAPVEPKPAEPAQPSAPGAAGTLTTPAAAAKSSGAATSAIRAITSDIPVTDIARSRPLATAIQQKLTEQGYLDPPPDGNFATVSLWALAEFARRNEIDPESFGPEAARMLDAPRAPLAMPRWSGHWIDRVIDHMARSNLWYCRFPGCRNIVYLEGANTDGTLNDNPPDRFNDLRAVFWFEPDGAIRHQVWEATTEPGRHFTTGPKTNPAGAARIKFGQYKSWVVGMHRGNHEALTQVGDVSVYRDLDRNFQRKGDKIDTGLFGINQHHGFDVGTASIENTSAGCLVGRLVKEHEAFMSSIKEDPRYQANRAYRFVTTILPAAEILRS